MEKRIASLIRKENMRQFCAATLLILFSPLIILVMTFMWLVNLCAKEYFNYGVNLYKYAFTTYRNVFSPTSYPLLKDYSGQYDEIVEKNIRKRGFYLTDNFVIIKKRLSFDIIPKSSVVWVYHSILTERLTTKYGSLMHQRQLESLILKTDIGLEFSSGIRYQWVPSENQYVLMVWGYTLEEVFENFPDAIIGYNVTYEKAYKKNPRNFIEEAPESYAREILEIFNVSSGRE